MCDLVERFCTKCITEPEALSPSHPHPTRRSPAAMSDLCALHLAGANALERAVDLWTWRPDAADILLAEATS